MNDPRLVEIEFLSALERERPKDLTVWTWAERLKVSKEFFTDMVFGLFRDGCLDGAGAITPPGGGGTFPPAGPPRTLASWGQNEIDRSVRTLLSGANSFAAHINHAGRLRLWRMRDEIFKARIKDSFDLLWDKRHWDSDLTVRLAMKPEGDLAAVMFIDVDDFKSVNERAGHTVGDDVLRIIFQTVLDMSAVGGGDAYRWGGDEITVLLLALPLDACEAIANAIRTDVERQCGLHPAVIDAKLKPSVSIGIGAFTSRPEPVAVTAKVADLMKEVKAAGKNSVLAKNLSF
jgi:diguanylate cyclase (GGDEF)-like protein